MDIEKKIPKPKTQINIKDWIANILSSQVARFMIVVGAINAVFYCGIYYANNQKNIEILEVKTNSSLLEIRLNKEIAILEIEIEHLKFQNTGKKDK